MSRLSWRRAGWVVGAALLALVLWRTGTDPFVAGVRSLDVPTLALGAALAVPITVACAWRWCLVARGLGVAVDPATAVASCYRAQFLNTVLPGGVLGDVHRGVRHGLRAVVWERTAGQVVQAVIAVALLLLLPSPVRGLVPWLLGALVAGVVVAVLVRAVRDDLWRGVLGRAAWPGVAAASTVAVAGHLATYVVAARAVGVTASTATLLPLAVLVLVAAGLPTNLAGWGPREGAAAWAFAAAGLGAGQGVATAVAYGGIVAVASLPGAVVLLLGAARRRVVPAVVAGEGGVHA
jgi:hypothetical protein